MDGCVNLGCFIRKRNLLAHLIIWTIVTFVLIASLTVFEGTLIGIFYTIFFLTFVLIFQGSHSLWARTIRVYCILLIAYSASVSLLTYSFQFSAVESLFKNVLSTQALNDIGLNVKTEGWMVFIEPFTPLIITLSLILYLKIFDDDFDRFAYLAEEADTALSTPLNANQVANQHTINDSSFIMLMNTNPTASSSSMHIDQPLSTTDLSQLEQNPPSVSASRSDLRRASRRSAFKNFIKSATECFWRVAETHFIKLVIFMIFRLPIIDVCLLNFPFIIIVILAFRYPSTEKCVCLAASWLISFLMVARNLSNLASLKAVDITKTCANDAPAPLVGNTYSFLQYLGLNLSRVDHYILVLILITIYFFIRIHYERRSEKTYELSFGVIFTGVGEREADMGCLNLLKYFCNFGFYKFGIEFTCLALVITIANRLDSLAAIYGIILLITSVTNSKRFLASVWPVFNLLICLLIAVQYLLRLGLPEALCKHYPWENLPADFKHWLYFSDYAMIQDADLLLFDFLVLLTICRQSVVFQRMTLATGNSQMHHSLSAEKFRSRYLPNEDEFAAEDCFTNYTNQNNYLKSIFFVSIYWITLAVVLVAGATKISLFSLGYLVGCFIFLWLGNDTYLLPLPSLICRWNYFISYAAIVIFTKVIMQLFSCYYQDYLMQNCYILQLSRVVCYRKIHQIPANDPANACASTLPNEELDILWDGLCLMFLMMQRIVFGSRYFGYLVKEVKAQQILASRGAELILATQMEEAKAQESYEKDVMRNIREKMESLKSDNELTSKAWQRLITLPHHHQIIRNADKHLFSSLLDEPSGHCNTENQQSRSSFIPDPIGDELQRMADINGISAVITRWMKGQPLYGTGSCASPGGGQEPPRSDSSEAETTEEGRGLWEVINLIIYSCLLSATVKLNILSRSYRYVSRRMVAEKNILKRDYNPSDVRFKSDPTWRRMVIGSVAESYANEGEQLNHSLHRIRSALKIIASRAGSSRDSYQSMDQSPPRDRSPNNGPAGSGQQDTSTPARGNGNGSGSGSGNGADRTDLMDPELQFLKLNMFSQFCRALAYVFISNTSLLCQLVIVMNQVLTASLLSLPLPLLTFLWGTLSVPRPTKRFWKTVITYTEIVIVIKYIFQFPLWNWQPSNINPFYYPNLLGIKNITIVYDLLLLLALFFHRSMLKSLGQWDATLEGESKGEFEPETKHDVTRSSTLQSDVQPLDKSINSLSGSGNGRQSSLPIGGYQNQAIEHTMESYQNELSVDQHTNGGGDRLMESNEEVQIKDCKCFSCCLKAYVRTKRSITLFFCHVLNTPYKVQTDVYTWMFLCDFINFLILIYGFWAFGGGYANQTVASFLNENRIPFSVLIMLLAQFGSIIIDRAFYLQKNIAGKLMFQVILVIGIHFWLFFALPFTTGHALTLKEYWPPKAWYVFKCIYFLLSAHQIRCGYPRRVLGNCFTRGYGYANWFSFKVYRAIPLVYDLRLYMDWIWTETTLEFRNWNIMEDMFANLFIRKCELCIEEEYPQPRARPIRRINKYLFGGSFIVLILAIIWGPLLLFSMGKTVGESNLPVEMEYELEFVGFQPILRMRATAQQIDPINENQYNLLKARFVSQGSQSFLGDYKIGDVAVIRLDGQSNAVWEISPPSKELLMTSIKNNKTLTLKSTWTFFRIKREKSQNFDVSIAGSYQHILRENSSLDFRSSLYDMLADSSTTLTPPDQAKFVVTPPIFPNFLRVPETGQVSPVDQFEDSLFEYNKLRALNLTYIRMYDPNLKQTSNSTSWWRAEDLCKYHPLNDSYSFWPKSVVPHCDSLVVVTFNDRIFTGILALLSAPGIIGLYTTFVVFFARLIRTEPAGKVIYTEIPKVDRVYGLIMDIYMMRECKEFELEEKLFAKLLFLYRSPEMLIEWSKREDGVAQLPEQQQQQQQQQQQVSFQ